MRYDQDFLDNLKQQTDIVRLVQDYVPLKKKGNNYWACCPFHGEKTASFSVNPKGFFYCFGCGKKGSAFNFVMEIENIGFGEAVRVVADKQGVKLPAPQVLSRADEERLKDEARAAEIKKNAAEIVIKLNSWAMEFWENHLQENNPEARAAREYIEKRGISEQTQKTFRLGYAPDAWDALLNYLKQQGADEKTIETSGLVGKNEEKNRVYDRFRGRLIFPVLDVAGKPVAFGARTLGAGEPKYLNSPETAAYTKGNQLYGLFQNAAEIRRRKFAILVEGYLDLITPFQHGVGNCVASLGTALTTNQARLLSRYARRVKINYDGDKAGIKAAQRAIEILLAADFEIKVLVLPNGADPDEFIRQNGVGEYNQQHAKRSITFAPFVLEQATAGRDFRNAADKQAAFDEVLPFLRVIRNSIERREFFDAAINRLNIDEAHRSELLKSLKLSGFANQNKPDLNELKQQIAVAVQAKPTVAEEELLELLLHDKDLRDAILPTLEPSDYEHLASGKIFRALVHLHENGDVNIDNLEEIAGDSDLLSILRLSEPGRADDEALDDYLTKAENCVITLRQMAIERRLREIRDELVRAEQNRENERFNNLLIEQMELSRLRNELGNVASNAG